MRTQTSHPIPRLPPELVILATFLFPGFVGTPLTNILLVRTVHVLGYRA